MPAKLDINVDVRAVLSQVGDLGNASITALFQLIQSLTDGVIIGTIDKVYAKKHTITAGSTLDLDFSAGGLLDPLNNALSMARIKFIAVKHEGTAQVIAIGAASNPVASIVGTLRPSGLFMQYAGDVTGFIVTNTTADTIRFTNPSGADATITVLILGCSA